MKRIVLALVNLITVPGIGTWAAGRKKLGLIQSGLSILGLLLTFWPIWSLYRYLEAHRLSPEEFQRRVEMGDVPMEWQPILLVLSISLLGILIYGLNWLWSAFTTAPTDAPERTDDLTP
jgi:hypothetical protein